MSDFHHSLMGKREGGRGVKQINEQKTYSLILPHWGKDCWGHTHVTDQGRKRKGKENASVFIGYWFKIYFSKLKIKLPYDPAIPLLDIHQDKTLIQKDTCTPMFIAPLFTIAKTWKQPKCPLTDKWIKKSVVHIYNGILLSHKKEQNNAICSNMDATREYHTKWSKSERERQISYDITYMWNLKYDTNELIYETETDSQTQRTDLWLPRGRGVGEGCTGRLGLADANYYM